MQPKSALPHLRLAEVHLAASDRDSAIDSLRKALSIQPGLLEAQRRLATLYTAAGKHKEAVAIAQQVQKQRPKQSVGYLYEGDIHASAKNWSEAAAAYRRGLKETSSVDLAARLYDVYVTSGDQTNAKQFSATWIKEHPKDDAFRLHLAQSAMMRQDHAAAAEHYRKLLDKQPNNALLLNNLAWASAHIKDPKALEYAEQAYKIAPDQPAIMDTLGILLVQKGETVRGIELLRKASAAAPQSPDVRLNLAKALIKAGQKDEAKKELDELAKLGQKFPRHAEVKQLMQGL
jgi:putative PEP-CTERM system TPR-repeat lipoprotein